MEALPTCDGLGSAARGEMSAPKLSVNGRGTVVLEPDVATVSVGVRNEHETAQGALAVCNELMTRVTEKVKEFAEEKDIKTSNLSLNPHFKSSSKRSGDGGMELTGFTASNQLSVIIRDIDKVGDVLSLLVNEGVNNINGISFSSTVEGVAAEEARTLAVRDARRKADVLAAAAGYRVEALIKIDSHDSDASPMRMSRMAVMEMASAPVSAGQLEISSDVHIEYALAAI